MPLIGDTSKEVQQVVQANKFKIMGYRYKENRNNNPLDNQLIIEWVAYNEVDEKGIPVTLKAETEFITGQDLIDLGLSAPTESTRYGDFKKALYDCLISRGIFTSGTIN